MAHDIFLSHSSRDKKAADTVCERLETSGLSCWMAPRDILPGESWPEAIERGIEGCKVFVLLLSGDASASEEVMREVHFAGSLKKKLVQVRIEDVQLPKGMRYYLTGVHRLDAITRPLEQHIAVLTKTVWKFVSTSIESKDDSPSSSLAEDGDSQLPEKLGWKKSKPIEGPKPPPKVQTLSDKEASWSDDGLKIGESYYKANEYSKAIRHLRTGAECGHPKAQFYLAEMYYYGRGVKQDRDESARWYLEAAKQGHLDAQCELADMYSLGKGIARNSAEARKWYRRAAIKGHVNAQWGLGFLYDKKNAPAEDKVKAVRWYQKAADQNHVMAQSRLGEMYEMGDGVSEDKPEAIRWYRRAAEQGHASAQLSLGYMYEEGIGVTQDKSEARRWYRKSAAQGNVAAKVRLSAESVDRVTKSITSELKFYN